MVEIYNRDLSKTSLGHMTPDSLEKIRQMFLAARELSAEARIAFLETECAGDAAVRAEVEELLLADAKKDGPHADSLATIEVADEDIKAVVPGYHTCNVRCELFQTV